MRRTFFLFVASIIITSMNAQTKIIQLNTPDTNRGSAVMKALSDRKSDREFSEKELSTKDLSDLLWAANGINRKGEGKRTAPSAMNKQDIDVYAVMKSGTYLYDHQKHALVLIAEGDHRKAVAGGQDFVLQAPLSLVLVSDLSRFGNISDRARLMGAMDAGIVSQNINLFCAGIGLVTVTRASMDFDGLKKVLKLTDSQVPMINNPIGYPKK